MNLLLDSCIAEIAKRHNWLQWQRLFGASDHIVIILKSTNTGKYVCQVYNHDFGRYYDKGIYADDKKIYFDDLESAIQGFTARINLYLYSLDSQGVPKAGSPIG